VEKPKHYDPDGLGDVLDYYPLVNKYVMTPLHLLKKERKKKCTDPNRVGFRIFFLSFKLFLNSFILIM